MRKLLNRKIANLNLWQRLGIVISVIWFLGMGGVTFWTDGKIANEAYTMGFDACEARREAIGLAMDWSACFKEGSASYDRYIDHAWYDVAGAATLPIIFGWLAVYLAIFVTRWVLRGKPIGK